MRITILSHLTWYWLIVGFCVILATPAGRMRKGLPAVVTRAAVTASQKPFAALTHIKDQFNYGQLNCVIFQMKH